MKALAFTAEARIPASPSDNFVTALHILADRCDFGTFRERMIRYRFVVGLRDPTWQWRRRRYFSALILVFFAADCLCAAAISRYVSIGRVFVI
ncbi:hypothetical protein MTO96_017052 [Rhipicephalus appendiculatus]